MGTPTRRPRVCVLALMPLLTVTIEAASRPGDAEVHVHAGGQGPWLARMAHSLGVDVVLCGPFGGENGSLVEHLVREEGIEVRATPGRGTGAYVHDRRDGERDELASVRPVTLDRHELDDLYSATLVEALEADVLVLTGDDTGLVPASFLGRIASDARAAGIPEVSDLSGDQAAAVADVEGTVLKMSHSELTEGGFASGTEAEELVEGARGLLRRGAAVVMVSRADEPSLAVTGDRVLEVSVPDVSPADHRGAGDSMTAGISVGLARGDALEDALRLGAAAGVLNATRHGLGTGGGDDVDRLAGHVTVSPRD